MLSSMFHYCRVCVCCFSLQSSLGVERDMIRSARASIHFLFIFRHITFYNIPEAKWTKHTKNPRESLCLNIYTLNTDTHTNIHIFVYARRTSDFGRLYERHSYEYADQLMSDCPTLNNSNTNYRPSQPTQIKCFGYASVVMVRGWDSPALLVFHSLRSSFSAFVWRTQIYEALCVYSINIILEKDNNTN